MPASIIQKGDDVRKNWRSINANTADVRGLAAEVARLRGLVPGGVSRDEATPHFPFRVYARPPLYRAEDADPPGSWWRRLYVEHGYVNTFPTEGCEDTDAKDVTEVEIEVPEDTATYYIWVEATWGDEPAAEIQHGADPWEGYPNLASPNGGKFCKLLAIVDTATELDKKHALIRQFVRADLFEYGQRSVWL